MSSTAQLPVGAATELTPGARRVVSAGECELLVRNCGGRLFAIENGCSHEGAPLNDGAVDQEHDWIECRRHGSRFDLRTGRPLNLPAYEPNDVFDVETVDGIITVQTE